MFGAGTPQERAKNLAIRQQQTSSILDFIKSDMKSLTREVTGRDRDKIDEYFTGVREIEQRIQAAEKSRAGRSQPTVDSPEAGIPSSYREYVRLMFDMLFLAFQTDTTRVATFMISGDGNNRDFAEIGITDGHHNLSHHGNRQDWIQKVATIDHFYVTQLAYFLEKMEAAKDLDGKSLLHNSQIIYGSGNSDGKPPLAHESSGHPGGSRGRHAETRALHQVQRPAGDEPLSEHAGSHRWRSAAGTLRRFDGPPGEYLKPSEHAHAPNCEIVWLSRRDQRK